MPASRLTLKSQPYCSRRRHRRASRGDERRSSHLRLYESDFHPTDVRRRLRVTRDSHPERSRRSARGQHAAQREDRAVCVACCDSQAYRRAARPEASQCYSRFPRERRSRLGDVTRAHRLFLFLFPHSPFGVSLSFSPLRLFRFTHEFVFASPRRWLVTWTERSVAEIRAADLLR